MASRASQLQLWSFAHYLLKIPSNISRWFYISIVSIVVFGGSFAITSLAFANASARAEDSTVPVHDGAGPQNQPTDHNYLSRSSKFLLKLLKIIYSPTSSYFSALGIVLALVYSFRALEAYCITLPGTQEYNTACPGEARRTRAGVFVKLFAASVTTIGAKGHLSSLRGPASWKLEAFRALEVLFNPLASIFSFSSSLWYGFIDLLNISPGPWATGASFKYRFARLCHCSVSTISQPATGDRLRLSSVSPHHLMASRRRYDLTWISRILVLFILLGQYTQAIVLIVRRVLSSTAAAVDYIIFFMALSGLVILLQSLIISLLNVSWVLDTNVPPCALRNCTLSECVEDKNRKELPNRSFQTIIFGLDVVPPLGTLWCELAGGFVQFQALWCTGDNLWRMFTTLLTIHVSWRCTLISALTIQFVFRMVIQDALSDSTDDAPNSPSQPQTPDLPSPVPENAPRTQSVLSKVSTALIFVVMFCVGLLAVAWTCMVVVIQLFFVLSPGLTLLLRIASKSASWNNIDPTIPCPHLWKDSLEDELWWF